MPGLYHERSTRAPRDTSTIKLFVAQTVNHPLSISHATVACARSRHVHTHTQVLHPECYQNTNVTPAIPTGRQVCTPFICLKGNATESMTSAASVALRYEYGHGRDHDSTPTGRGTLPCLPSAAPIIIEA